MNTYVKTKVPETTNPHPISTSYQHLTDSTNPNVKTYNHCCKVQTSHTKQLTCAKQSPKAFVTPSNKHCTTLAKTKSPTTPMPTNRPVKLQSVGIILSRFQCCNFWPIFCSVTFSNIIRNLISCTKRIRRLKQCLEVGSWVFYLVVFLSLIG